MDKNLNLKYFEGPSLGKSIALRIVGSILLFPASIIILILIATIGPLSNWDKVFWIFILTFSIILLFTPLLLLFLSNAQKKSQKKKIISDRQYEESFANYPENIVQQARDFILSPNINSLIAPTEILEGYFYPEKALAKLGEDKLLRTNHYQKSVLFFCKETILCYFYKFETTSSASSETAQEIQYLDIVGVSIENTDKPHGCETYVLVSLKENESIHIPCKNTEETLSTISNIRAILRNKIS